VCKSRSFDGFLSFAKAGQVKVADDASSEGEVDELSTQDVVLVVFDLEGEVFVCF